MTKPPKEITLANLEVVVMPNGEILCLGRTVGWVKDLGRFITVKQRLSPSSTRRRPETDVPRLLDHGISEEEDACV